MSNEVEMTFFEWEAIPSARMSWEARRDGHTSGARALILAILADAVLCVERGRRRRHPRTRQLAAEAETWMRSDCREWPFSFASICDVLGIDANALRAHLSLSNGERPANGGRRARAEADEPPTRSREVTRTLPRSGSARGSIAGDIAREPIRNGVGSGGRGCGSDVRTRLEVA